ncbi:MAG TPA: hypothetical protein VFI42_02695 [Thermomicrobiaceae bacterium]|nr:hypothetical protein [Thermomicrobiaceae bacterium]
MAALALLLAVPAGITLERSLSSGTPAQPAQTTVNAPAPPAMPHWKFVEINQMPEAPSAELIVQPGGPR